MASADNVPGSHGANRMHVFRRHANKDIAGGLMLGIVKLSHEESGKSVFDPFHNIVNKSSSRPEQSACRFLLNPRLSAMFDRLPSAAMAVRPSSEYSRDLFRHRNRTPVAVFSADRPIVSAPLLHSGLFCRSEKIGDKNIFLIVKTPDPVIHFVAVYLMTGRRELNPVLVRPQAAGVLNAKAGRRENETAFCQPVPQHETDSIYPSFLDEPVSASPLGVSFFK